MLALALAAGYKTLPAEPVARAALERQYHPLAPSHNHVHSFDRMLPRHILEPIASAYVDVMPAPARRGVHNVLSNLGEPFVAANDLLQGNVTLFWTSFWRFGVNSTIGLGGLFDVAASDF